MRTKYKQKQLQLVFHFEESDLNASYIQDVYNFLFKKILDLERNDGINQSIPILTDTNNKTYSLST